VLINALGMEGSWKPYSGKHAGIELECSSGETLYFHDTRHFGTFHVCREESEYNFVMKDVGPDLLNDDVPFEDYSYKIRNNRIKNKEICSFMMDQSYFSGIGNYLLAEILYECRILPTRKLKDLSDDEVYSLWSNSIDIINQAYNANGKTIRTYFSMSDEAGTFECKCYGQQYDPEGRPVYTGTFSNGRTSHYVPDYQF